jgi:hypothetical protein
MNRKLDLVARRVLALGEIPEPLADMLDRAQVMRSGVSAGILSADAIVILALVAELKLEMLAREQEREFEAAENVVTWKEVAVGTPVRVNWRGKRVGIFRGLGERKKVWVELEDGKRREIRASRVQPITVEASNAG